MKKVLLLAFVLLLVGAACQKQTRVATNTASGTTNVSTSTSGGAGPVGNSAATNTALASTIDPCSLITKGEAEAVFGKPAQESEFKGAACRYDTVDKTKFFDLTAKSGTGADFETMKNLCDSTAQAVAGLGTTSCSANNTVVMLKNTVLMTLIAGGVFNQDQLKGLAVTAASRIP